jgi:GTP-binding protein
MNPARSVAIVGRPNVGKSRLFNRLAGRRIAIVHDLPGVTRDVNATDIPGAYTLFDTGGIGLVTDLDHQKLIAAAEQQVWFAVEAAAVICFVVDGREGLTGLDEMISSRLRAAGKPVVLAVNKLDSELLDDRMLDFAALGFAEPVAVSAEHGRGADELHARLLAALGPEPAPAAADDSAPARIRIAFCGRPNVGKSSLCNRLLADERLVVSEIPGTTRDSVALDLDYTAGDGRVLPFALVDTAGLKKSGAIRHSVEYFSGVRARAAIEEADIVFLVIDAIEGVTRQDQAVAGEITAAGKCVCVLVNKWDLAIDQFRAHPPKGYTTMDVWRREYAEASLRDLFFLPQSPVVFVSARTGLALDRILRTAHRIWEVSGRTLPTPRLNRFFEKMLAAREPRLVNRRRFKIYYAVQTGNRPFTFRIFCNRATKLDEGYRRYLENGLVREFNLQGCPIRFDLRGKTVRYAGDA